jgi:NADH-quinone oxidoreductase subunit K
MPLFYFDLVSQNMALSFILFMIGFFGIIFNRNNILLMLMSLEILLLSINLTFLFFSVFLDDIFGQIFALFLLTVAAAESSIGLAILVVHHRLCYTISVEWLNLLKGIFFLYCKFLL